LLSAVNAYESSPDFTAVCCNPVPGGEIPREERVLSFPFRCPHRLSTRREERRQAVKGQGTEVWRRTADGFVSLSFQRLLQNPSVFLLFKG